MPTTTAKFSKRHYEFIAATIRTRRETGLTGQLAYEDETILNDLAHDFAREFSGDNPRFDAVRFLEACGL